MVRRGVVLQRGQSESIVLTPEGEFEQVRAPLGADVGEEIEIPKSSRWRPYALAAAFLIVLVGATLFQWFQTPPLLAYVSMDINPSLELGVDGHWRVQSLQGLNVEGEALADELDYRGRTLTNVVETVLSAYPTRNMLLFTVCQAADVDLLEAWLHQLQEKVSQWRDEPGAMVEVWEVSRELRELAQGHGLSVGRLTLALAAHEQGAVVELDDIKWGDMVRTLAHRGINVGQLVRQAALEGRWEVPEDEEELPAWMRSGRPVPPGLDKEPGQPAQPPRRPVVPPGEEEEPGTLPVLPRMPVQPPGLRRGD